MKNIYGKTAPSTFLHRQLDVTTQLWPLLSGATQCILPGGPECIIETRAMIFLPKINKEDTV
jgi:hypothetical protein